MAAQRPTFLNDLTVRAALGQAWQDSQPAVRGGHEEGGFVLRDATGNLNIIRWPKGDQHTIVLPPHPDCRVGEQDIVVTFHTHPNTGSDYVQEPSETDRRAVRDDPNLKGRFYEGELVVSQQKLYLIAPNGEVSEVDNTEEILLQE